MWTQGVKDWCKVPERVSLPSQIVKAGLFRLVIVGAATVTSALAPSVQPAAATSVSPWVAAHVRDEHLQPGPMHVGAVRSAAPMNQEPSLSALRAKQQAAIAGTAGTAAVATTVNASIQFLTRPYTVWHNITSVFDHCNPDYTTDNRVCEFDGSVGWPSNPGAGRARRALIPGRRTRECSGSPAMRNFRCPTPRPKYRPSRAMDPRGCAGHRRPSAAGRRSRVTPSPHRRAA